MFFTGLVIFLPLPLEGGGAKRRRGMLCSNVPTYRAENLLISETGRPLTNVDITPEMIEAGTKEYALFEQGADSPTDFLVPVFLAMVEAQKAPA